MSIRFTAAVAVALMLSLCGSALAQRSDRIESWGLLEENLSAEIEREEKTDNAFDVFSWDNLKTLATSQRIEGSGLTVWREALRCGRTMSQLVAYHCIAEHAERFKTDAALSFLLLTKQIPSVFRLTAAGQHLRGLTPTQKDS